MTETMQQAPSVLENMPEYVRNMLPYRPGKPLEELKEEYGFEKVIKLASNENPFGCSPKAIEAATKTLADNFRYPDPVSRRLRRKIAETLGLQSNQLVVAAGSESLLAATIRAVMKPGEKALTAFGAFMGFEIHLAGHGGKLEKIPSPDYRFDIDALIAACTPDVRILYLPNPNNPTGSYFTHQELQTLLAKVPKSTLVLLDEAYIEFAQVLPDYPKALTLMQDNLLILRTFSKAYGLAGFRIGYGIGHPMLIEQLTKIKMTFEPTLSAQAAAEAAWDDTGFLMKGVENNQSEMKRYYQVLHELGLKYVPSAGNFVFIECQDAETVNNLNEALLRKGIAIRPLASFGFPNCIRITIGLPEENDATFQALREIVPTL